MACRRLGFACQYRHPIRSLALKELEAVERAFNPRGTTLRWLGGASQEAARGKLMELVEHNLDAQENLLGYVATLPPMLHMLRLSSDLLPFYSHPHVAAFYRDPAIQQRLRQRFARLGELARGADIRLSMHPGQYCVLGSDKPGVVDNSVAEFEYHADMIRMMGYGQHFQDFKCNVHVAGRLGVEGVRAAWPRLSMEARNCITFENEEWTYGIDDCLQLADLAPVVLDIHHAWLHEGARVALDDPRLPRIVDSWRGVRPVMHYSQPPEKLQALGFDQESPLPIAPLLEHVGKRELCLHSDLMWNQWCNRYALGFHDRFDIMFEAKHKNLAVLDFHRRYVEADSA